MLYILNRYLVKCGEDLVLLEEPSPGVYRHTVIIPYKEGMPKPADLMIYPLGGEPVAYCRTRKILVRHSKLKRRDRNDPPVEYCQPPSYEFWKNLTDGWFTSP